MDGGIISYEEAIGASPAPSSSAPISPPVDNSAGDDHPLTVHPRLQGPPPQAPAAAPPVDMPTSASPSIGVGAGSPPPPAAAATPPSNVISYEDAITPDTPNPGKILSNAADDSTTTSALKGLGTTLLKGAGHIPGIFGDAMDLGDYLIARAQSKITGRPIEAIQAEQLKDRAGDWTDPRNYLPSGAEVSAPDLAQLGEYKPTSEPGKLAMAGGEAAVAGLAFGGGTPAFLSNTASGVAGQGATDATGDPLIGIATGMLAPGLAHAGAAAVGKIAGPALAAIPDSTPIVGPIVQRGVESAAARKMLGNASDPAAAKAAITGFDPTSVEVPGTMPTAAAVANDPRLLQAEMTARGTGGSNVEFNDRDAVQNNARVAALNSTQPQGDVFRPGQFITQNLDAVDAAAQRAQDQLEAAHAQAVAARAQGNQAATDRLAQSFQAAHDQLQQAAQSAAAPLGEPVNAEDIGATLRTAQQEATTAAKQMHNRLYDAVDPDGTLATVVTPLKEAKAAIQQGIDPHTGVQPTGAEAKIWSDIDRLPDVVPFRSLQKLDSRVTAAMADARRNPSAEDPEAISRLTQLKSATMSAIHDGVENQAAHEAKLVQAGVLAQQDAMQARIRDLWDLYGGAVHSDRQGLDAGVDLARTGTGPVGFASGGTRSSPRYPGAGSEKSSRFPAASSDQRISPAPGGFERQLAGYGDRTVSAQMHASEIQGALGQDIPGTVVRPFSGPLDRATNLPQGVVAYHGTPHDFDRFSSQRIGTGEGAQAYGHGLYFAENKNVAENYRDQLSPTSQSVKIGGKPFDYSAASPEEQRAFNSLFKTSTWSPDVDSALQTAQHRLRTSSDIPALAAKAQHQIDILTQWKRDGVENAGGVQGHLYNVRIARDPDHFLNWDAPIEDQSAYVQRALASPELRPLIEAHQARIAATGAKKFTGSNIVAALGDQSRAEVSQKLQDAGIAGIKYLDQASRSIGAGTNNYVVFNDRDISVTHKNDVPLARPAALPDYLRGEAKSAFGTELRAAGMSARDFSGDLTHRAEQLLDNGMRLDHGRALEEAFGDRYEALRGSLPGEGRGDAAAGSGQPGSPQRVSSDGLGRGGTGQTGGAPGEPLKPNFTPEAGERLNAAKAAYAAYAQTFKNPTVSGPLATNGFVGQYKMPAGAIPSKWIVKGDKGFETANAFLAASGNDPRAISAMQDALLNPLRKGAMTNGTIHQNALERWKAPDAYGPALRAIDAVSPGFSSKFDTAAHATQAVLDAGIEHKRLMDEYQRQAAAEALTANAASKATMNAGLASVRDQLNTAKNSPAGTFARVAGKAIAPTEVENTVGAMLKTGTGGAARMRELVQSVSADPDALEGLRKAGVDWIVRTHLGATEAGASGAKQLKGARLISFIVDNRDVLKELFTNAQISMMGAVGRSIETDAKWIAATTAKNGPGTAKDSAPKISQSTKEAAKHGSMMLAAMEGLDKGMEIGGFKGAGVAAAVPAAYLVGVLRHAGMKRIDDVYTSMMIDPEVAKIMLSKMPETMESSKWHALTRVVRRGLINGPLEVETKQRAAAR